MTRPVPNLIDPHVIAVVGGLVDEVGITLAIYGENLEPNVITETLGIQPTWSHRRGEQLTPSSPSFVQGAWLLSVRCENPVKPDDVMQRLFSRLPNDEEIWRGLASAFDLQLRLGVHYFGWNKGFDISPQVVSILARMHLRICLDLYAYGEEKGEHAEAESPSGLATDEKYLTPQQQSQRGEILRVLEEEGGDVRRAAKVLGISKNRLYQLIRVLSIPCKRISRNA